MSLFFNTDTNIISIRRGDSGVLRFIFSEDCMCGVSVTFAVKTNKDDRDEDAVITKTCICGSDPSINANEVYFLLTPEDTINLDVYPEKSRNDYQDYFWMLKIETNNGALADTVIPNSLSGFPKFRLYYGAVPSGN